MPDFSVRAADEELMARPDSPARLLGNTLRQFRWINRTLTPCHRLLRRHVLRCMRGDRTRAWTMLDIGSGGCDLPLWLVNRCRREGLDLTVTCIDHDPRVVEFARRCVVDHPEITLAHGDALSLTEVTPGSWDFIFSNHFLHHLSTPQIVHCLRQVVRACRVRCIMSDLVRSRLSYWLYTVAAGVFLRDSFAYDDGRLSIRKSLTKHEARLLLAGDPLLADLEVRSVFPGHLVFLSKSAARGAG
ncbi:MAG: methyltransferase domain-containing protein [Planctomycetia bacterium]